MQASERDADTDDGRFGRAANALFAVAAVSCALVFMVKLVTRFHVDSIWDDALMFQRYAQNVLTHHGVAWHPGGEPTYGLTSLLFLVVSVLMLVVTAGNSAYASMGSSVVCGLVFLALASRLLLRSASSDPVVRRGTLLLIAVCLAGGSLSMHFLSGMDTTFAMAYVTAYILAACRVEERASTGSAVLLGAVGGLAFAVRPELVLYSAALPLALAAFGKSGSEKKLGLVALAVSAALLVAQLAFNSAYFHSALPLAFYAKSTNLYGEAFRRTYRFTASKELIDFVRSYWPLFAIIALDVGAGFRTWRAEASRVERGVAAATVALLSYYWLLTLQVMGSAERFYQPLLPGLIYLTGCGAVRCGRVLREVLAQRGKGANAPLACVVLACLCWPIGTSLSDAVRRRLPIGTFGVSDYHKAYWFGIQRFSALPDDLVIATTEVGVPGVMNPNKRVVDIAGLNERSFSLQRFSGERLFNTFRPDLIYLPHPDYVNMVNEIEKSPEFARYDRYTAAQLCSFRFGIALRKDSPHYPAMRAIVADVSHDCDAMRAAMPF